MRVEYSIIEKVEANKTSRKQEKYNQEHNCKKYRNKLKLNAAVETKDK
ncbi:MAG: hypothetical protein NC921_01630 [Candidatus Omnitrophica bacterium]|nr:hypothetical protein [Candidatus Omnitrophota bacterium]MCM8809438.1 hypothetical protein [Candidatus Omnitrophota bacterium]